jgi:hypothetical protein
MTEKEFKSNFLSVEAFSEARVRFTGVHKIIYFHIHSKGDRSWWSERNLYGTGHKSVVSFVIDRADERIKIMDCFYKVWEKILDCGLEHDFIIKNHGLGLFSERTVVPLYKTIIPMSYYYDLRKTLEVNTLTDIFVHRKNNVFIYRQKIDNRSEILDL